MFFLILISLFFIPNISAKAATFYEAEWIPGIYLKRYNFNTKLTYYQQARFYRNRETNEYVYCIEPFEGIIENASYEETINPNNLSEEKRNRISNIAYFGYGYGNHTEAKWFAITQLMIWQAADEAGNFYFTNTLNGSAANLYTQEMTEINQLIERNNTLPSFSTQTFEIVEGTSLVLEDQNQILNNFHTDEGKINGNTLTIDNLEEGEYEISITKNQNTRSTPTLFYLSNNSQNMVKTGSINNNINTKINVKVVKTSLEVHKIDEENESTIPQGDASLDGAIYQLSNANNEVIEEIKIIDNEATLENLEFGDYTLKEIEAGEGYLVDDTVYEFSITSENPNISLTLKNKVIKANITIEKIFGEDNNWSKEENIAFWIKNKNDKIIQTVTTNEEGIIETELPYGTYTLVQVNTTEGYEIVEPFTFEIKDQEDLFIQLKDLRIEVPDTHKNQNLLDLLFQILWLFL